jgi:hypothetical protein
MQNTRLLDKNAKLEKCIIEPIFVLITIMIVTHQ